MIGIAGCRIWLFFFFMCGGFRTGSFTISGYSFVVVLHSFRSFASLPICLSPAREMCGLRDANDASCRVSCIGHILVAMSW